MSKTYKILTTHDNYLVKQGNKIGFFTKTGYLLRLTDIDTWKYAVEYWDKQVVDTEETFNFTK